MVNIIINNIKRKKQSVASNEKLENLRTDIQS